MKTIFETERLRLREFNAGDADFIVKLLNSPGWLQFIGDRNIKTKEQAEEYIQNIPLKSYREHGYGLSMVETKDGTTPIGMCGILHRSTLDIPDIGFALLPEYGGKGYAFEIASATIQHARNHYDISKIAAIVLKENIKSIQLLGKLGFIFSKEISFPGNAEVLQLYINNG